MTSDPADSIASMVTALMTPLIPGAGPPPTSSASRPDFSVDMCHPRKDGGGSRPRQPIGSPDRAGLIRAGPLSHRGPGGAGTPPPAVPPPRQFSEPGQVRPTPAGPP